MRYRPMGLVITARAATKSTSCNQSIERIRVSSEFLRPEHGHQQINEQQQGDHAHDKVFHSLLLKVFAEADVKGAHEKEHKGDSNEDQVTHNRICGSNAANRTKKLSARWKPMRRVPGISAFPLHPATDLASLDRAYA
jgi:hypothetical protein